MFTGTIDLRKIIEGFGWDEKGVDRKQLLELKSGRHYGDMIHYTVTKWMNTNLIGYEGKVQSAEPMDEYDIVIKDTENNKEKKIEVRLISTTGLVRVSPSKLSKTAYSGDNDSHKNKGLLYNTAKKIAGCYGYIFVDIRNFQLTDSLTGFYDVYFVTKKYLFELLLRGYFGIKGEKSFWKGGTKIAVKNTSSQNSLNKFLKGEFSEFNASNEKNIKAKIQFYNEVTEKMFEIDKKIENQTILLDSLKRNEEIADLYLKVSKKKNIASKNQAISKIIENFIKEFKKYLTNSTEKTNEDENLALFWSTVLIKEIEKYNNLIKEKENLLKTFHEKLELVKGRYVEECSFIWTNNKKLNRTRKSRAKKPLSLIPTPAIQNNHSNNNPITNTTAIQQNLFV